MRQSAKTVGLRLGLVSAVLTSCLLLASSVEAKAKPQWSPPIPPGKEAITLTIRSVGKVKTVVTWGRRTLGETPLVLKWPRNSGPVDVVLRAQGHLPVHTRLFTFNDDKVTVKLVDEEGKKTLFGYKREVPAPAAAAAAPAGASAVDAAKPAAGVAVPAPTAPAPAAAGQTAAPTTPGPTAAPAPAVAPTPRAP